MKQELIDIGYRPYFCLNFDKSINMNFKDDILYKEVKYQKWQIPKKIKYWGGDFENPDEELKIKIEIDVKYKNIDILEYCESWQEELTTIDKVIELEKFISQSYLGTLDFNPYSYIYLIKMNNYIKIGKSDNPYKRLAQLQTSNPEKLELLSSFPFDKKNIIEIEKKLHTFYKPKNIKNEWFNLDKLDIEFMNFLYFFSDPLSLKYDCSNIEYIEKNLKTYNKLMNPFKALFKLL